MKMIEHHIQLIIFPKVGTKDYNVMIDGKNVLINKQTENLKQSKILE